MKRTAKINRRRLSAYRFLKICKLQISGKGKVLIFDIANIPDGISINEFLIEKNRRDHGLFLNSK